MTERPAKRSRTIASQACDSCRQRKIKCDFGTAKEDACVPVRSWAGGAIVSPQSRVCRGCDDVGIPCTFNMPVKRRGPPSKLAKFRGQPPQQVQADNSQRHQDHASQDSISSSTRSPFAAGLQSPYDVGMQLPPIQDHSPTLFHLRYAPRSDNEDLSNRVHPTDRICPRPMFNEMMQDYIDLIYPLVPVVHKPTFLEDLKRQRELYDPTFLALITAMCATLVAHIPSRFYHYCSSPTPLRFPSRYAMVEFCHEYILTLKRPDTFDHPTHTTWSTSYLLSLAYVHLGKHRGRTLLLSAENMQQAYMLEFHNVANIEGLSCIDRQLRKKAFWLCFFGYVHQQMELKFAMPMNVYQPSVLGNLDFEALIPLELDDEYILLDTHLQQPSDKPSITIGFNANCRTFWAAVSDATNHIISPHYHRANLPLDLQLSSLQIRLQSTKHALSSVHPKLTQWSISSPSAYNASPEDEVRESQWESMRANTYISHLWLQSMLFEHMVALTERMQLTASPHGVTSLTSRSLWNSREDICRSLLLSLYNLNASNLEPNGNVLVNKIRTVATTLLDCPFELQGDVARRANGYIAEFAGVLAGIDRSDDSAGAGERYWSEVDGLGRRSLGEFAESEGRGSVTGLGN